MPVMICGGDHHLPLLRYLLSVRRFHFPPRHVDGMADVTADKSIAVPYDESSAPAIQLVAAVAVATEAETEDPFPFASSYNT
jgi:hypothetical protein